MLLKMVTKDAFGLDRSSFASFMARDSGFWSFVTLTVLGGAVVLGGRAIVRALRAAVQKDEPPEHHAVPPPSAPHHPA